MTDQVDITATHRRDLLTRLLEQYGFLQRSMAAYDAGSVSEGVRLASTVRTLVHDTGSSSSLLAQLRVKSALGWLDSDGARSELDLEKALAIMSLFSVAVTRLEDGFQLEFESVPPERMRAEGRLRTFESWWTRPVLALGQDRLARKDIVTMLANQDGGAHVDLQKESYLRALASVPIFELTIDNEPAFEPAQLARATALAAMRSIATEVHVSLRNQIDTYDPTREVFPR